MPHTSKGSACSHTMLIGNAQKTFRVARNGDGDFNSGHTVDESSERRPQRVGTQDAHVVGPFI
jgi:hypothetical protein